MSAVMVEAIIADVSSLMTDSDTATTFTVYTPTGSSLDPATGTLSHHGDQDSVTGWRTPLTAREAGESDAYQVGDVRFMAPESSFTRAPNTDSSLSDSTGARFAVVGVETAYLGDAVYYEIIARPSNDPT